jgi:hypothetical protein
MSEATSPAAVVAPVVSLPFFVVKASADTPSCEGLRFELGDVDEALCGLAGWRADYWVLPRLRGDVTSVRVRVGARGSWPGSRFVVEVVRP